MVVKSELLRSFHESEEYTKLIQKYSYVRNIEMYFQYLINNIIDFEDDNNPNLGSIVTIIENILNEKNDFEKVLEERNINYSFGMIDLLKKLTNNNINDFKTFLENPKVRIFLDKLNIKNIIIILSLKGINLENFLNFINGNYIDKKLNILKNRKIDFRQLKFELENFNNNNSDFENFQSILSSSEINNIFLNKIKINL